MRINTTLMICLLIVSQLAYASDKPSNNNRADYEAAFTTFYKEQGDTMLMPLLLEQGIADKEAKKRIDKFIEGTIECHMQTMDMNSDKLTKPTYAIAAQGGSYTDAKKRFDSGVRQALSENDTEILEPLREGVAFAQECVEKHTVEAGF